MFRNYLKIAIRNLIQNKLYCAINTIGLATGFAACILIMLYVRHELSYDEFWDKAERIGRINTTVLLPGRGPYEAASASTPMKEIVETYFPGRVVAATRFIPVHPVIIRDGEAFAEDIHLTDPETAQIFDMPVLRGDLQATLNDKASLAISATMAEKYFGDADPIGQVLHIKLSEIDRDYRIGAVFKDLPDNTALAINGLAKFDLTDFPQTRGLYDTWGNLGEHQVYIETVSANDFAAISNRLPDLVNTHVVGLDSLKSGPDAKVSDFYIQTIQPITDIHLNPVGIGEMKPAGDMDAVRILVGIALAVLLIACINFTNLVTAKSTQRAREVVLRKVLGANRSQLVTQFAGETILLAGLGLLFGLLFVEISLPGFNRFLNLDLVLAYSDGTTLLLIAGLLLTTGLIAGVYPAFIVSGFKPALLLRANRSTEGSGSRMLRSALVVLQFSISTALIVATATVYMQTWFVTNKDPGYSKDNVLVLNNTGNEKIAGSREALKQAVLKVPGVRAAGYTDYSPIDIHERLSPFQLVGTKADQTILISTQSVDHDYLDTYKIPMLAGRFYSRDFTSDGMPPEGTTGSVVINKTSAHKLGFTAPKEAIGQRVTAVTGVNADGPVYGELEIIGVTPDFYFQSPKKAIRAEVYLLAPARYNTLAVKYDDDAQAVVSRLETIWKSFSRDVPFQYEFVEDTITAEFERESTISKVLATFASITVIIACLGLYGLAAFTAERRTREIGIRKVMGARVFDIVRLLVWQFSKPVLVANLIAWPLVVWVMSRWLETFPYRIETWNLWVFCLGAGALSLAIAWATVCIQSTRVARTNPIRALRYE